ncbi:MAG: methyltransferase domain-containing protein [Halobacteriota archaeon]
MIRLAFELSGENQSIPRSEVLSLFCGDVVQDSDRVIVLDVPQYDPKLGERLAMSHTILEVHGICEQNLAAIHHAARQIELPDVRIAVRAKRIGTGLRSTDVETAIGKALYERGYRIDLTKPELTVRALLSEGSCVIGAVLLYVNRAHFESRRPRVRPFFYPGVLLPRMARVAVNLAGAQPRELLLDPFCGTGGILLEAGLVGTTIVGSDADSRMVHGTRLNLDYYNVGGALLIQDARQLGFRDRSVDTIVTDLPYGRSVSIHARSIRQLREQTLDEMFRVLKAKGRAVLLSDVEIDDEIEHAGLRIKAHHHHYVHKSLTREIIVAHK